MTIEEITNWNLRAVENAVAQQRIEGLDVPPDVIKEMKRAARGEIDIEEGIGNAIDRFTHGEVRVPRSLP